MFLCSYTLTIVVLQFDCVNHLQGCMQLAVHIELRARSIYPSTKATENLIGLCRKKAYSFLSYQMELHISNGRASASCEGWLRCIIIVLEHLGWGNLPTSVHVEDSKAVLQSFAQFISLASSEQSNPWNHALKYPPSMKR